MHGAPRPAAAALYAAHAVPLPGPDGDVVAAWVHDLLHRRDADTQQFLRVNTGDGPAARGRLVWAQSRKTFDGLGRIVKVGQRSHEGEGGEATVLGRPLRARCSWQGT